jgi:hypothetical protein
MNFQRQSAWLHPQVPSGHPANSFSIRYCSKRRQPKCLHFNTFAAPARMCRAPRERRTTRCSPNRTDVDKDFVRRKEKRKPRISLDSSATSDTSRPLSADNRALCSFEGEKREAESGEGPGQLISVYQREREVGGQPPPVRGARGKFHTIFLNCAIVAVAGVSIPAPQSLFKCNQTRPPRVSAALPLSPFSFFHFSLDFLFPFSTFFLLFSSLENSGHRNPEILARVSKLLAVMRF